MTEWVEQWIFIKFCIKLEHSFLHRNCSDDSEGHSYGQLVIGSFITTMHQLMHHIWCRDFGETSNHSGDSVPYSPDLEPWDFWLFPKLKSLLKRKKFQAVDEIQENMAEQLMAIGRTVWGDCGVVVLSSVFLVSCIFFNKCLYFSYYMTGYFLDRPHMTTSI